MWLFISIDTDTDSLNSIFSEWTQREFFNKLRAICRRKLLTSSWAGEKKQKQMWLGITLSGKFVLFLGEVVLNLKLHANFRSSQVLQQLAPILYFLRQHLVISVIGWTTLFTKPPEHTRNCVATINIQFWCLCLRLTPNVHLVEI